MKSADPNAPPDEDDILAATVNRLVRFYLDARIKKEKPEWDFAKFREAKKTPPEASEVRRKLAERLFLVTSNIWFILVALLLIDRIA